MEDSVSNTLRCAVEYLQRRIVDEMNFIERYEAEVKKSRKRMAELQHELAEHEQVIANLND